MASGFYVSGRDVGKLKLKKKKKKSLDYSAALIVTLYLQNYEYKIKWSKRLIFHHNYNFFFKSELLFDS